MGNYRICVALPTSRRSLVKLINPFLLDSREAGGLGLSTSEVGFVYGTVGIIGLTLEASSGGFVAATVPQEVDLACGVEHFAHMRHILLSGHRTTLRYALDQCLCLHRAFGYGFGFTAYMLYLIYFE